jgi:hypothetical protein
VIVKVQISHQRPGKALVRSQDWSTQFMLEATDVLEVMMLGRTTAYFETSLAKDGQIKLGKRAPVQDW